MEGERISQNQISFYCLVEKREDATIPCLTRGVQVPLKLGHVPVLLTPAVCWVMSKV